jgi:hypothetical protein
MSAAPSRRRFVKCLRRWPEQEARPLLALTHLALQVQTQHTAHTHVHSRATTNRMSGRYNDEIISSTLAFAPVGRLFWLARSSCRSASGGRRRNRVVRRRAVGWDGWWNGCTRAHYARPGSGLRPSISVADVCWLADASRQRDRGRLEPYKTTRAKGEGRLENGTKKQGKRNSRRSSLHKCTVIETL